MMAVVLHLEEVLNALSELCLIPRDPADCSLGRKRQPWSAADRKSTRLNSSHTVTSYAVFCLKKKKMTSIGTAPAQNAVAVCRVQSRRRIWAQCIARIGAANVRSDRASKAVGIFIEVGEIVFIAKGRIIGFWRQDQWGAAFPPADKLRSQTIAGVGITGIIGAGGCLVEKIPKLSDALGQLTEHEIRPVAAEIVHPGFGVQAGGIRGNDREQLTGIVCRLHRAAGGDELVDVGMAQKEFAHRKL